MKLNSFLLVTSTIAFFTSCGLNTSNSQLGSTVAADDIKIAYIDSNTSGSKGSFYASVKSESDETTICSIADSGAETCFDSSFVKSVGDRKIYRINGDLNISTKLKLSVKTKDSDSSIRGLGFSKKRRSQNPDDGIEDINDTLSNFPADKGNFELTTSRGQGTTLKKLFTGEYMLLEASSPTCPPCVAMARMMNGNTQQGSRIRKVFEGKKCTKAILPASYQSWIQQFPASTFVGKSSYGVRGGGMTILRSFGFQGSSIPSFVLVDRQFNIIDQGVGRIPAKFYEKCE